VPLLQVGNRNALINFRRKTFDASGVIFPLCVGICLYLSAFILHCSSWMSCQIGILAIQEEIQQIFGHRGDTCHLPRRVSFFRLSSTKRHPHLSEDQRKAKMIFAKHQQK